MSKVIQGIIVLLGVVSRDEIEAMAPAERERFAQTLKYWAGVAEKVDQPKPEGVLSDLKDQPRDC